MRTYRQGRPPLSRWWLVLNLMWPVGLFACTSQDLVLKGWWISTDITHPSPFFSETLTDDKSKSITLSFDEAGGFEWRDREEVCHVGVYLVQDHTLVLTDPQGEAIILGYTFEEDQLRLKSPDGFIFDFRKVPPQADAAGANPCNQ
ncbi:MAG: hypothetical protein MRJ67_16710 [Nitrospirales bacterium]|nr:hypothetical protein [Nitrospirales bacterium]MDR4482244.1 hypothetical protein [Nitrospirales bacterium]